MAATGSCHAFDGIPREKSEHLSMLLENWPQQLLRGGQSGGACKRLAAGSEFIAFWHQCSTHLSEPDRSGSACR